MSQNSDSQDKANKPHARYAAPGDVVVDPELNRQQKEKALESLEQDARQLDEASAEGMAGGKRVGSGPSSDLNAVLEARDAMQLPPVQMAYKVVIMDLRSRIKAGGTDAATVLGQALQILERHCDELRSGGSPDDTTTARSP